MVGGLGSLDPCVCVCVPVGTFLWEDSFMFNHWELSCGGDLHKTSIPSLGAFACYKYRVEESVIHTAGLYSGSVNTLRVWPMLDDLTEFLARYTDILQNEY